MRGWAWMILAAACAGKENSGPGVEGPGGDDTGATDTGASDGEDGGQDGGQDGGGSDGGDGGQDDGGGDDSRPDSDGDGIHDGADCAPSNPEVYPGAVDIPYDGIDQDCNGEDLIDADGDGFDGTEAGGDDCDDTNAEINPGATDGGNGRDDDCDGEVDENAIIYPAEWPIQLGGPAGEVLLSRVATTATGSAVVAGAMVGRVDFEPTQEAIDELTVSDGSADGFLAWVDTNRQLVALAQVQATDPLRTRGLWVDASDGATIGGPFEGTLDYDNGPPLYTRISAGGTDGWFARYDSAGRLDWGSSFGGAGDDAVSDVHLDASGTWVGGWFATSASILARGSYNTGTPATWATVSGIAATSGLVIRVDTTGGPQASFVWDGLQATDAVEVLGVRSTGTELIVAGAFTGGIDLDPTAAGRTATSATTGLFIVAVDPAVGTLLWSRTLTSATDGLRFGRLALTPDGDPLLVGSFGGSLLVDGRSIATATTGRDGFYAAFGAADGGPLLGGTTDVGDDDHLTGVAQLGSATGDVVLSGPHGDAGLTTCWVQRRSLAGTPAWTESFDVSSSAFACTDLAVSADGNVLPAGALDGYVDFGTGGATLPRTLYGTVDGWVHRFPG